MFVAVHISFFCAAGGSQGRSQRGVQAMEAAETIGIGGLMVVSIPCLGCNIYGWNMLEPWDLRQNDPKRWFLERFQNQSELGYPFVM